MSFLKHRRYDAMLLSLLFFSLLSLGECSVSDKNLPGFFKWLPHVPFLALAEFKYQNLFNWSSGGGLVTWFVPGLLLLVILLQRPTSESVFQHTRGCS